MKGPYIKGAKQPKGFYVSVEIDNEKASWYSLPDIMSNFQDEVVAYGRKVQTLENNSYWKVPRRWDVLYWLRVVNVELGHEAVLKLYKMKIAKYTGFLCTAVTDNGFTAEGVKCEEIP